MSEAAVLSRQTAARPAGGSVLIVDDEAAIRESLETLLEFEGYAVESAVTGEDGLARMAERPFDLVLLDFALPDRNGLEILADIRSRDPGLAVIMITASPGSRLRMSARISRPLRSGRAKSSRTRSKGRSAMRDSPSSPVSADSTA